jgi:cytochrome c oxidase cbb3-type subunit 3
MITTIAFFSNAQDGEGLFKSKCNACHMLGKNSTGPNLKGVKQKWIDAEEGDMIYEWVMNPQTLIASGKSQTAMKSKEFSPTDMTPQQVSKEEIDAILGFVDNYEEPAAAVEASSDSNAETPVVYVPNYNKNLTKFYFLSFLMIVLLLAILLIGNTSSNILKIQLNKHFSNKSVKSILALVGLFGIIAVNNNSHALTFLSAGEGTEGQPWLLVEDKDIYFMLILNLVLVGVLFYIKKSFNDIATMLLPQQEKKVSKRAMRRKTNILTDIVPITEEHTILLEHEYDGIRELDNNLPPWWVWGFYATIVFSIIYIFNFHILGTADLQIAEYEKSMAKAKKEVDAYLDKMAMNVDESNVTLMTEKGDINVGKTLFETNCVACHNPDGEGNIGPNLTDKAWIYGYDIKEVFATIKNGTSKGMPEHNSKLNPIQLQQVSSFVLSLQEKAGKAPEGDIIEK